MVKKIVLIVLLNIIVICVSVAGYVQFIKPYLVSRETNITFDCGFSMPYGCKSATEEYKQLELKTNIQYIIPLLVGLIIANLLILKLPIKPKK